VKKFNKKKMAIVPSLLLITLALLSVPHLAETPDPYFGNNNVGPSTSTAMGYIVGNKFTLGESGTVTSISLYVATASGNARVAIYSDSSGSPGTLIVQSGSEAVTTTGWRTFTVTGTSLSPGSYWLFFQVDSSSFKTTYSQTGGVRRLVSYAYGAFPGTFPGGGKSDSVLFSIYASYTTADYSISASPDTLTISKGSSDTSTITVTSTVGGFNSPVTLSCTSLPTGVTCLFNPNPVTPPAGSSTTSTLTLNVDATATDGYYTINVVGTAGSISHSTPITLEIISGPDFTITTSPNTLTLAPGDSGASMITVTSVAGYSDPVSLSISGLPSGATGIFDPTPVTPPADGSAQSTLTISTDPTVATGTFTLTVTATSGPKEHTTTITLRIPIPKSHHFSVRTGITKIIVTLTWTGTESITIQLASPTTTYTESGMTMYEKITINVDSTTTYNHIKRAELVVAAPASDQIWTVKIYTDVSSYDVSIETS